MYAAVPLGTIVKVLCGLTLLVAVAILALQGFPPDFSSALRFCSTVVTVTAVSVVVIGGSSEWYSPWRIIWKFEPLNRWFFPDLNGKWIGTIQSNWPRQEALKAPRKTSKAADLDVIEAVPLKNVKANITITASWFKFVIEGEFADGNNSCSITEALRKHQKKGAFSLAYVYIQSTPNPASTDEESHYGAADLELNMRAKPWSLSGPYWTRRNWRQAINTAGILQITRAD